MRRMERKVRMGKRTRRWRWSRKLVTLVGSLETRKLVLKKKEMR